MSIKIENWAALEGRYEFTNLVIGNGASCAIYDRFAYRSLYEAAQSDLSPTALSLFNELDTQNFEAILHALYISSVTAKSFEEQKLVPTGTVDNVTKEYDRLRRALFDTVAEVHIPYMHFADEDRRQDFAAAMADYKRVFSLNYDLLPYWSLQVIKEPLNERLGLDDRTYTDFFSRSNGDLRFDPFVGSEADLRLYYLHGGVHLWSDAITGEVGKLTHNGSSILDRLRALQEPYTKRRQIPLFISEGSSASKMQAIQFSRYLRFCYRALRENASAGTVVFGTELGDVDTHIAEALIAEGAKPLAFSIYAPCGDPNEMEAAAWRVRNALPKQLKSSRQILFFDSTTHPLGSITPHSAEDHTG